MNGTEREHSGIQRNGVLRVSGVAVAIFLIVAAIGVLIWLSTGYIQHLVIAGLVALLLAWSIRIADQWERVVVLRLGRFQKLAGPGFFLIIPIVDETPIWIDMRIRTTFFAAEKTLTRDNVPVNVDAVMFWMVNDPMKAALEVEEYQRAVFWAAQTALRDIIGKTELYAMLAGREQLDEELERMIDQRTEPWGVEVRSVEIRDVMIPTELQDAMSREAQAERERRARIILGTAELEIADKFAQASLKYHDNPEAFSLRAMNILYEGLKEKASLVIVPSDMVHALNPGNILGYVAHKEITDEKGQKPESTS
ncbi:MAG: slipin family protein [Syntrophomonadaceae bacterium]|jgi:regulator of protease activity HflC (stomatin/prohibitin superfamily)|nr:slipin family protein [Syntrophomonadaceae bacterium]